MPSFALFLPLLKDQTNKLKINYLLNLFSFHNFPTILSHKFNFFLIQIRLNQFIHDFRAFLARFAGGCAFNLANISLNIPSKRFKCPTRALGVKGGINTRLSGKIMTYEGLRTPVVGYRVRRLSSTSFINDLILNNFNGGGESLSSFFILC